MAGAIVQWLRDNLGIIQKSSDVEKLACTVQDTDGVYTGSGLYWTRCATLGQ